MLLKDDGFVTGSTSNDNDKIALPEFSDAAYATRGAMSKAIPANRVHL